jgi:hypothetical protein
LKISPSSVTILENLTNIGENTCIDIVADVGYNAKEQKMDANENGKKELKLYTPQEVADMFGITTDALKSRRRRGQIEAIVLNDRSVVYTEEQIKKADLSPRKRGPKPKKTQAKEQAEEKEAA